MSNLNLLHHSHHRIVLLSLADSPLAVPKSLEEPRIQRRRVGCVGGVGVVDLFGVGVADGVVGVGWMVRMVGLLGMGVGIADFDVEELVQVSMCRLRES